jgi:hypothetical protein
LAVVESLLDLNGIPESERKGENAAKSKVEQIFKKLDENGNLTLLLKLRLKFNLIPLGDQYLSIEEFVNGCLADDAVRKFLIEPLYNDQ